MNKEVEITRLKKLKKGDKIKLKDRNYIIEDFKEISSDKEGRKVEAKEVILRGEGKEEHLKGKYAIIYNEKTGETKFCRMIEEKEASPNEFKFKSQKTFFYRNEK
jgi:hypothetical protein